MKSILKDSDVYQMLANYSLTLNVTLDNVINHLNNICDGICDVQSQAIIVDEHIIKGKSVKDRFDILRQELINLIDKLDNNRNSES